VVLVAHGSRAAAANQAHLDLAAALDARVGPTVVGAFMELAEPSIADAVARAAEAGATVVAVLPYFLHPGRHQRVDIPQLVADAAETRPGVEIRLLDPFGSDPAVLDLLAGQVARSLLPS
jgi:sirohydrochlorin cobaltochelatase